MTQALAQVRNVVARSGFANPLTLDVLVVDATQLAVYADGTLLTTGSDYSITGLGDAGGVEIEIIGAEDVDNYVGVETFTALYTPVVDQNTDLSAGGAFGTSFEAAIDAIIRRSQAIDDRVTRSLKVPVYIEGDQLLTPEPGMYLGWDDDGLITNLDGTAGGGGGTGTVDSVNGLTGTVVLDTDDISDTARTNKWATQAEKDKLGYITVSQAVDLDTIESTVAAHAAKLAYITVTQPVDLDAIETNSNASKVKTDYITVTQAVDLDAIETNSNASKVKTDFITVTQPVDLDAIEALAVAAAPQTTTYTKTEVDALVTGLKWKDSVRVATTAAGTLATSFENGDTVDGVVLATGDRILLKNQATAADNGIYVVAASGAPTRATDANTGTKIKGMAVFVEEGTTNADTAWVLTNNGTVTLGSTSLTYAQFAGAGVYAADGTSLQLSGNTFSVKDAGVSMAKLADLTALSVIGRASNTSGVPAAIAAANDGEVMRRSGTAIGFGTIATAGIADAAVTLAKMANMATASLLGRNTAGTGVPEVLSAATAKTLLAIAQADVSGLTTASSPQFTGIELGHATDTTLSRSAAGQLAVEGVDVLTTSNTKTLTNKRVTPRVGSTTSSATPSINTDDVDAYSITALAVAITSMTTNLTGTPTNFQKLIIRIKDNGTARAITWGTGFEAKGVALPTTTVISKVLTVGFIYDTVTSKWGCVASAQEA